MAFARRTFRNSSEFMRLKEVDASGKAHFFIMKSAPAQDMPARFGMIATKKTFDNAINRNRARRLMREWVRLSADKLDENTDYLFILRRSILDASLKQGMRELARLIKH